MYSSPIRKPDASMSCPLLRGTPPHADLPANHDALVESHRVGHSPADPGFDYAAVEPA